MLLSMNSFELTEFKTTIFTKWSRFRYLDRLTMDAVWKSIFGIDVDMQSNPNLVYFVKAKEITDGFADFNGYFLAISNKLKISYYYNSCKG